MLTWVFIITTASIIWYQRQREGRWLNLMSLLMTPYLIIVTLNNLWVYKLGFYLISNDVLRMLLLSFIIFFLATLPFKFRMYKFTDEDNRHLLRTYNIKAIKVYLYIIGIFGLLKALWLFRQGTLMPIDEEGGGMSKGIIIHLLLASYAVLPIYFLHWTYSGKKIKGLIPIILIVIVAFSSFVKYNVIGPIIMLFIFLGLYRTSQLKKYIIILPLLVLAFFIANYAIGFAIMEAEVDPIFYIAHFWKYFAGSLIYDNYIFTSGIRVGMSIGYKLMGYICALPNMFTQKLFETEFFEKDINDMKDVSDFGEQSNVVDAIGGLYPSRGEFGEILWFYIVIFISGLIISYIYIKSCNNKNAYSPFIANFLTYFVFLNFFSSFFSLTGPWEILIWSLIVPYFFRKNTKLARYYKRIFSKSKHTITSTPTIGLLKSETMP